MQSMLILLNFKFPLSLSTLEDTRIVRDKGPSKVARYTYPLFYANLFLIALTSLLNLHSLIFNLTPFWLAIFYSFFLMGT